MKEATIDSFQELHAVRRSHWDEHFVYRGEDSTTYTLQPKFGRRLAAPYKTTSGSVFPMLIHEQAMLAQFKRRAAPFLERHPTDDWDWLAVAQHHGLATRLLDWTENILVAAYFACRRSQRKDTVIYALDTRKISSALLSESPFLLKKDVIFHPRHSTSRIAAQSGLFTVHADPAQPFAGPIAQRLIVSKDFVGELAGILGTYDIKKSRLFPGLDSLAEEVNGDYACS